MKRRILFAHQNFPGQFGHAAKALADAGHEGVALGGVRKTDLVVEAKRHGGKSNAQILAELHSIDKNEPVESWECAVLVCNAQHELANIGQLYKDRTDCENGFDEIKNRWRRQSFARPGMG